MKRPDFERRTLPASHFCQEVGTLNHHVNQVQPMGIIDVHRIIILIKVYVL